MKRNNRRGTKILVEDSTKDPSIFLGSILIEVKVTKSGMEGEGRVKGVLYQSYSAGGPPGVAAVKSIINSSAEKGARIQRIPSLTPPNSFSATRAPSQGVERELGRESQVAATINQISSKLSRLFDRHRPLSPPSPPGPLRVSLSGTIGPRVNWKKKRKKGRKKKKKKGKKRWRKWVFEADELFQWLKVAATRGGERGEGDKRDELGVTIEDMPVYSC